MLVKRGTAQRHIFCGSLRRAQRLADKGLLTDGQLRVKDLVNPGIRCDVGKGVSSRLLWVSPADTPKLGAVRAELACRVSPFLPHFSYQLPRVWQKSLSPSCTVGGNSTFKPERRAQWGGEDSVPGGVLSLSTVGLASLTGKQEEDSLTHPAFKAASKLSKIISWSLEEERLNR